MSFNPNGRTMLDDLAMTHVELDALARELDALEDVLQALDDCELYKPIDTDYEETVYLPIREKANELREVIEDMRERRDRAEDRYQNEYYAAYPEDRPKWGEI